MMLRFETWRRLTMCTSPEKRVELADCGGAVEDMPLLSRWNHNIKVHNHRVSRLYK